jgi:hypothetical protein
MAEVLLSTADTVALREQHLPQALLLSQSLNWPYRLDDWRDALGLGHGGRREHGYALGELAD